MIDENIRSWPAMRLSKSGVETVDERVAVERPVTISLNGEETATLLCMPTDLDALAVGFLVSDRRIPRVGDVMDVYVDEDLSSVHVTTVSGGHARATVNAPPVITSGCGGGRISRETLDLGVTLCLGAGLEVSAAWIRRTMQEFAGRSETFRKTGGVHSAAICADGGIEMFAEDIGRHNAVDKVIGRGLLEGIDLKHAVLFSSGRISAEVTLKAAFNRVRVVVSRAAPTSMAIDIAQQTRVTLVGFVRGDRMTVFTQKDRIVYNREKEK